MSYLKCVTWHNSYASSHVISVILEGLQDSSWFGYLVTSDSALGHLKAWRRLGDRLLMCFSHAAGELLLVTGTGPRSFSIWDSPRDCLRVASPRMSSPRGQEGRSTALYDVASQVPPLPLPPYHKDQPGAHHIRYEKGFYEGVNTPWRCASLRPVLKVSDHPWLPPGRTSLSTITKWCRWVDWGHASLKRSFYILKFRCFFVNLLLQTDMRANKEGNHWCSFIYQRTTYSIQRPINYPGKWDASAFY